MQGLVTADYAVIVTIQLYLLTFKLLQFKNAYKLHTNLNIIKKPI